MNLKKTVDISSLDNGEFREWIASFDVVLSDCDGVLYIGHALIDGADSAVNRLVDMGKKIYLITNNNRVSREDLAAQTKKMNFNLEADNMICASNCAARYLSQRKFKKVYVIGCEVLVDEIEAVGVSTIGSGPDVLENSLKDQVGQDLQRIDKDVEALVVGFDEHLSFPKLFKAVNYLRNPLVEFIAVNIDESVEFPNFTFPDAGPIIAAIENATKRTPTVIAKPSQLLREIAIPHEAHRESKRFLMIGDRLNTDILFGNRNNFQTLLVGTGIHQMSDVQNILNQIESGEEHEDLEKTIPDYFVSSLKNLFRD